MWVYPEWKISNNLKDQIIHDLNPFGSHCEHLSMSNVEPESNAAIAV